MSNRKSGDPIPPDEAEACIAKAEFVIAELKAGRISGFVIAGQAAGDAAAMTHRYASYMAIDKQALAEVIAMLSSNIRCTCDEPLCPHNIAGDAIQQLAARYAITGNIGAVTVEVGDAGDEPADRSKLH